MKAEIKKQSRKHTSTNAARRYIRKRDEGRARAARKRRLEEKRDMLICLCTAHEKAGNLDELTQCKSRLRTTEQQILYINGGV